MKVKFDCPCCLDTFTIDVTEHEGRHECTNCRYFLKWEIIAEVSVVHRGLCMRMSGEIEDSK